MANSRDQGSEGDRHERPDAAVRAAWAKGNPPELTLLLTPEVLADPQRLADTLAADIEERRERGLPCGVAVYAGHCPGWEGMGPVRRVLLMGEVLDQPGADVDRVRRELMRSYVNLAADIETVVAIASALREDDGLPVHAAGEELGKYRLDAILGSGAFARTWLAWNRSLHRHVALKILGPSTGGTGDDAERVLREARAAASLDHPAIVRVHEAGRFATGEGYIDTQFVGLLQPGVGAEGCGATASTRTLRNLLATGPVPPRVAAELVKVAAHGLAAAHARGIVHSDVKPENILLTPDGAPLLADFGLAMAGWTAEGGSAHAEEKRRRIAGTPAYIAPEVARGESATPLSDVFSLGCTLRALLTGQSPRRPSSERGDSSFAETLVMAGEQALAPLAAIAGDVPTTLARICDRATEHAPRDRYGSADQLAADLAAFLEDRPTIADPPGRTRAARLWFGRHRRSAAVGAGILAVAALSLTAFILRLNDERQRAVDAEFTARAQRDEAIRARNTIELMNRFVGRTFNATRGLTGSAAFTVMDAIRLGAARVGLVYADRPLVEAAVRHFLGQAALGAGEFTVAAEQLDRALLLRREHLGPTHPDTLATLRQRAELFLTARKIQEGEAAMKEIVAALGEEGSLQSMDGLRAIAALAGRAMARGELDEARRMLEAVSDAYSGLPFDGSADQTSAMNALVTIYARQKQWKLCESTQRRIIEINAKHFGMDDISTLNSTQALGWVLREAGKHEAAAEVYRDVLVRYRATVGDAHAGTLHVEVELAETVLNRLPEQAMPLIHDVVVRTESVSRGYVLRIRSRILLGAVLARLGHLESAGEAMRQAFADAIQALGSQNQWSVRAGQQLATLLENMGKPGDATAVRGMLVRRATPLPTTPEENP